MRRAVFNMRDERPIWSPPADVSARLREHLGTEWELVEIAAPVSGRGDGGGVSTEALEAIDGAEIYLGLGLPRELLGAGLRSGQLRWIHTGAAGVASLLHPELAENGITLTNSAGIHAEPMADTVLGMILYFARGFDHAVRARHDGAWRPGLWEQVDAGIRELEAATVGVVGFGGIGRAVARRANALGMSVVAMRRTQRDSAPPGVTLLSGSNALERLLATADYVVVTVPSTRDTRGMIDGAAMSHMRRSAVLINVARGDVIDEAALIERLRAGHLRGAGLDVFREEPLHPGSPLWHLPNVLITPHVSATSPSYWIRQEKLIVDNIERYMAGRPLLNMVDVQAGY